MPNVDEAAQQVKSDFLRDSGLTHPTDHSAAAESRRNDDAFWAQHDPAVEYKYAGQWVVPFERRIVANGADLEAVLEQAARVTHRSKGELLVCAIPHPDDWLADA